MLKPRKILRIGISIGDIHGVGPELVIRAFNETKLKDLCTPIIYGSSRVLNHYRKLLKVEKFSYNVIQEPSQAHPKKVSVVECISGTDEVEPGIPSPAAGLAAFEALAAAVKDLKAGELDALVTLPIDKTTIQNKDFKFPGHTEYLASEFGVEENLMLMVGEDMRMGVVTGHLPLKDVAGAISQQKVYTKIRLMHEALKLDFGIERPKIAVLGLNPHAGDHGLIGKEDSERIQKAVEQAFNNKMMVLGPFPADGFFQSGQFVEFDGILAMYHDQGLIPFKLVSGFEGTNYTAGLPVIRTSPDHGVAYSLAGKGYANLESLNHAIYTAIDVYRNRHDFQEIEEGSLWKMKSKERDRGRGKPGVADRQEREVLAVQDDGFDYEDSVGLGEEE